jgi:hypothetical protein
LVQKAAFGKPRITIIVPILVITDGTLWVADYAENGQQAGHLPKLVDQTELYLGLKYPTFNCDYTISHLHIYTKKGIQEFLRNVKENKDFQDRFSG